MKYPPADSIHRFIGSAIGGALSASSAMLKRKLAWAAIACAGVVTSVYLVGGGDGETATAALKLRHYSPDTCEAPHIYTPRHRWRVEEPPSGAIADNVRAVYEEMSKAILVRVGVLCMVGPRPVAPLRMLFCAESFGTELQQIYVASLHRGPA